ncbi:hypothetical protein AB0942_33360 [Streptomyces nodosus]|uniref:hypothetical protein n=1 Tax=Streptomyces nodosus TaxID=40318 RepID=UPI003454A890
MSEPFRDVPVWRRLARLMPGWLPTLEGLQKLDEGPPELIGALRSISRGWNRDDARWDVLMAVLEFYRRQHAHELAEKILEDIVPDDQLNQLGRDRAQGMRWAADLIDPEVTA